MKRVSRWLMSLCIAALLAGTVGILPAKAADAALKVTTPGNKVQMIIPECFEPPNRILRATIPENESQS